MQEEWKVWPHSVVVLFVSCMISIQMQQSGNSQEFIEESDIVVRENTVFDKEYFGK